MVQPTFMPLAAPQKLFALTAASAEQLKANERRVAVDMLRLYLAIRTPVTLWGPVGSRKTRTIESMAREKDENGVHYQVITIQPSTQDPTIIHGMMYTAHEDGQTVMKRSIPDVAKQIVEYHQRTGGLTILFADEMTTCMPSQQNAMLGLLTHGKFEGIDISSFITVCMAANPEGTVSTVNPLGEAVMNRGGHIAWFGDVSLFLDEWSTGFNGAVAAPDPMTEWYIRELLAQAPEEAFRNPEKWSPDSLIPWDMMEHTERAVTELARLITLINTTLAQCPDDVRRHYLVEAAKSILGVQWSERMANVTGMEADIVSPGSILTLVRNSGISLTSTEQEIAASLGDSLHVVGSGAYMRQDQAQTVIDYLVQASWVESSATFSRDTYTAAWAFAATAPTTGDVMSFHSKMLQLMRVGSQAVRLNLLERAEAIPAFLSQATRQALKELTAAERARAAAAAS